MRDADQGSGSGGGQPPAPQPEPTNWTGVAVLAILAAFIVAMTIVIRTT